MGFFVFVFFARYLGFCIFWGYLGLKGPHIFGEKNKIVEGSAKTLSTRVQISGSNSQKRVEHLDVCAVNCKNYGLVS